MIEKTTAAKKKGGEEELTLDAAFEELENLARALEDRDTTLEASFALYQRGMGLLKYCSDSLDTVEKKMLQLTADGSLEEFSR